MKFMDARKNILIALFYITNDCQLFISLKQLVGAASDEQQLLFAHRYTEI